MTTNDHTVEENRKVASSLEELRARLREIILTSKESEDRPHAIANIARELRNLGQDMMTLSKIKPMRVQIAEHQVEAQKMQRRSAIFRKRFILGVKTSELASEYNVSVSTIDQYCKQVMRCLIHRVKGESGGADKSVWDAFWSFSRIDESFRAVILPVLNKYDDELARIVKGEFDAYVKVWGVRKPWPD